MKTYLTIFKLKFMNNIQYRAAALAGISTQFFFGIVYIMFYLAFYKSNPTNIPMKWEELVSYLWLNQALFSLVYIWQKDKELLSMIKDGNISYEFTRPINFYKKWFATIYGARLSSVALRFLPVIIIALILPSPYNLHAPASILSFIVFLLSLFISSLLVSSITLLIHIITIYTIDEKGIMNLLMVTVEVLSGGTIPLVFFPEPLKTIAYLLPFRYIVDLPFRVYSGNIPVNVAIPDILTSIIWLFIIILLGYILSNNATKKAVIQGG